MQHISLKTFRIDSWVNGKPFIGVSRSIVVLVSSPTITDIKNPPFNINLKRKVVCVLHQVFPEYQSIFSDIFGKTSKEILLQFSSPIDFESISSQTLARLLVNLSRKQVSAAKAEQLKTVAPSSFGVTFAKMVSHFSSKL